MKRAGHFSVQQGKRVKVHLKNGCWFIAKFKERKGRYIHFFDHDAVTTASVTTLSIHKGYYPEKNHDR